MVATLEGMRTYYGFKKIDKKEPPTKRRKALFINVC